MHTHKKMYSNHVKEHHKVCVSEEVRIYSFSSDTQQRESIMLGGVVVLVVVPLDNNSSSEYVFVVSFK